MENVNDNSKVGWRWQNVLPIAQWLSGYQRQWLPHDTIAGVTLAAYAVPVNAQTRDLLRAEGLEERVGYLGRRLSVDQAVHEFEADVAGCSYFGSNHEAH